jgi:TPR repeat protein
MGVPKDEVESVRWHTKAAANGNAASQFSLGMFYLQGAGVPKDEAEGVKWLQVSRSGQCCRSVLAWSCV